MQDKTSCMTQSDIVVLSVNISEKKGTIKKSVEKVQLGPKGIEEDAHSGTWHRQISLLAKESIDRFSKIAGREINYGEFAENITLQGIELVQTHPLDRFIGCNVELEVTQIGKKCHGDSCAIFREVGNCVMPKEGIFARVKKFGSLKAGATFLYKPKVYHIAVITLSDRASAGEYEDKSGPAIMQAFETHYGQNNRPTKIHVDVIPDEAQVLTSLIEKYVEKEYDIIVTTGGTGIGPRDITPETIRPLLDKEISGIMDFVRMKYGAEKPHALLTRSLAGVKKDTLVYCLPGSVKAVNEYMEEILKVLDHQIYMLHGLDVH